MTLHPQIIGKKGKKEYVILSYDEFLLIQEALEDFQDLKDLREAKESSKKDRSVTLSTVKKRYASRK